MAVVFGPDDEEEDVEVDEVEAVVKDDTAEVVAAKEPGSADQRQLAGESAAAKSLDQVSSETAASVALSTT